MRTFFYLLACPLVYALAFSPTLLRAETKTPKAAPDAKLTAELTAVYAQWSKAMVEQDAALWKANTAQYRKVGIRNMIVSEGKAWPAAMFDSPVSPPDVSGLKLASASAKGVTAQLVYFGKADFGVEDDVEIPDGLLVLMFIKETSGWKFATTRFMSMAGADEVLDQAHAGDFTFLDDPRFEPPGRGPAVPAICPLPEIVGYVEVVSHGYDTNLDVAGRSKHRVIDNTQRSLIIGGLKAGINPIIVESRPLPPPRETLTDQKIPPPRLEVSVFRKTDNPDIPLKRIYHSGPKTKPGRFKIVVRGDS